MDSEYPLLLARTQNFTLGRPHRFTVSPDGRRVLFLRTGGGTDRVRSLWSLDPATGEERLVAAGDASAAPSEQERARRERARDRSSGIADYTTDTAVRVAAFTGSGRLFVAGVSTARVSELPARGPVTDPRPDPAGRRIAYVGEGALRVIGADGGDDRVLAAPDGPDVTWGLAEHEAAESMERSRGFWWAPDGERLAVARVDNAPVRTWWLTDPARPEAPPIALRYPWAGTPNADVSLWVVGLDGRRVRVGLDDDVEYLVDVRWDGHGLLVVVQNRAQSVLRVLTADPVTGRTEVLHEDTDPAWTTIVPGSPARLADGRLVATADRGDTRHLTVGGEVVTPDGLQVTAIGGTDGDVVLFLASDEPVERHVWTWSQETGPVRLTTGAGRYDAVRAGGTTVVTAATPAGASATVLTAGAEPRTVRSLALSPAVAPRAELFRAGRRELRTAVLFPAGHVPGSARLPVLMDPYGGAAAQRAVADRGSYLRSQWFADQGFAVVVADGRGTPGRGPRWERAIHRDRSDAILADQVDALHAAAERHPDLDTGRVGIRGWSAGGYLAALAVLRRPDVFHAAVAGAPVTDPLYYSTHWQERFLGDPRTDPGPYEAGSLIADAPGLRRPLMLVHGMLDDNVHPLHTMRLSAALLAAGRPHTVLPLPGASHMTPDVTTTAMLPVAEARFLLDSLSPVREI